ncbi:MAG: extracellular solute-binding protein [Anaerolineae bacterium]|nr:extracellular solute-binding protein [Anaerolineae bacterium]
MRKSIFVLLAILLAASMVLVACGGGAEPAATAVPAAEEAVQEEAAAVEPTAEAVVEEAEAAVEEVAEEVAAEEPTAEAVVEEAMGDKTQIRWFVGLGTGTNPEQVAIQEEVVADFNASQDQIELVLEIVPYDSARDTLATQIASGSGPDIIGPVGWGGSNAFYGQWLDIAPQIESSGFDLSVFDPALVEFYQTEEGQVGLPFAVFPGAMYFIPEMFDEAGLAYPPQNYGDQYELNGEMVDWNWETVTEVAKLLTVDVNGLNATEDGFDRTQIVQVGYSPQWQHPNSTATFYGGAAKIFEGDAPGSYESAIPDSWKEAWAWWYDGMYGEQPFIASGPLSGAPEFGNGNVFNAGKAAMGLTQTWYTCCLGELRDAGVEFQMGIQPAMADGTVQGRIDADTFRVWKGTANPEAAFAVLSYLITDGGDKLLPIYGAMPAIAEKTDAFFEVKSADYPFVTPESWDVFVQGLAYPDTPSAEQYLPNWTESFARIQTFGDLLNNTEDVDFDAEFDKLQEDLTAIYNKQ